MDDQLNKALDSIIDGEAVRVEVLPTYIGPPVIMQRATPHSAGIDLYASETVQILPGETKLIPVGLKIAMPEWMEAQVRAKSGRALKEGLALTNGIGTVDPDYRGELGVIAYNTRMVNVLRALCSPDQTIYEEGEYRSVRHYMAKDSVTIKKGEKVAQLVFMEWLDPAIIEVETLDETVRGDGGFGSTGITDAPRATLRLVPEERG